MKLRVQSVRVRLSLWNTGIVCLVLVMLGGILRFSLAHILTASMDENLRVRSTQHTIFWATFDGASHKPWQPKKTSRSQQATTAANATPVRSRWQMPLIDRVYDVDGQQSYPERIHPPFDWAAFKKSVRGETVYTTILDNDEEVRVLSVPLRRRSGVIAGVTQIAASLSDTQRMLHDMDRTLLALLPISLVCAGAGGWYLTHRMVAPVRQITQAAGQLGADDLSLRLPVTGRDEFFKLSATFNRMLERLEHAFQRQQQFTADASHELRSPLTVIRAQASLALSQPGVCPQCEKPMRSIHKAAVQMNETIDSLLFLARADAGQWEQALSVFSLADSVVAAISRTKDAAHCVVVNTVGNHWLPVHGSQEQLTRLFVNLLDNALRHTPQEGVVRITACEQEQTVQIAISDTGCGIAAEHLPHLGKRFYRADAARTRPQGGTGLGLAICQSIIAVHGGTLSIESEVGKGTTVKVILPKAEMERLSSEASGVLYLSSNEERTSVRV